MKRKIIILLAACVAAAPLQAQNLEFGGLTYNNDLMMSTDFAALSRSHPFGYGARDGDGRGFHFAGRRPFVDVDQPGRVGHVPPQRVLAHTAAVGRPWPNAGAPSWVGNNKTRFAFANVGVALNVFESPASRSRALRSVSA